MANLPKRSPYWAVICEAKQQGKEWEAETFDAAKGLARSFAKGFPGKIVEVWLNKRVALAKAEIGEVKIETEELD